MPRNYRRTMAICCITAFTPITLADQILEVHDASLTTYVPTGKTNVQDVRALPSQRGVHIDGTSNGGSGLAISGMGRGDAWNRNQTLSSVRLDTGTFMVNAVDIALPADVPWVIGRSYNARQKTSGGSYSASGGFQGKNWFQSSHPELVFHDSGTDSEDMIYLVMGADRYIEFRRGDDTGTGDSTDTFRAVNGAAGAIVVDEDGSGPDLATYYDQSGNRMVFLWFDSNSGQVDPDIAGSIWKIIDSAGNTAYVGHETNASTAQTSGFDRTTGVIEEAYDSAGRRFTYSYTSGMLTQVKVEVDDSGWVEVARVDYTYYENADSYGEDDDLELVTVTTPLTDSGVSSERKTYYRYYEGTYNATTNPGYHHQLQYVINAEGYRQRDWADSTFDDDPLSDNETTLKPYASAYFEYDTERRIVAAWFNGACGCSGATAGEHTFEYEDNGSFSNTAGYDTDWKSRTIVQRPDSTYETSGGAVKSYITQYFDEVGQPLHRVISDDDPDNTSPAPNVWATKVTRNSDGLITDVHTPANVTGYTHSTATLTASGADGLIRKTARTGSGDLKGFMSNRRHSKGSSGTAYYDAQPSRTTRTLTVGDADISRPLVTETRDYSAETSTGTTGYYATTMSYEAYHSGTATDVLYVVPKEIKTTYPVVSTGNNGSGTADTRYQYLREDGTVAFVKAEDGIFRYTQFTNGQLVKQIDDAKTNGSFPSGDDPNTDWGITESGSGSDRTTTYTYDAQGRPETTTLPSGRVTMQYYSKLSDGRLVTLSYPKYETSPSTKYHGPVSFRITNFAGQVEASGIVALSGNESTLALTSHVDETDDDPITAIDLGTVTRLTVNIYEESGSQAQETRQYFDVPVSGAGSDGTHYDPTFFAYDGQGRRYRTKAPHGTITRSDFDGAGRVVRQWIGTNDSDFDGGESSGTDDMVKTVENEYDSGNDKGNGYLTKRTLFVEDGTTGKRETTFTYDSQGRLLVQENPEAPHVFNAYDNLGRMTATAQYSSTAHINTSTDEPTTETSSRLALRQTFYDERGRAWKTQRHKIDASDGSDDDNLQTTNWYDATGRRVKQLGAQLTKTAYDRLGRQTHQFTLANDNDTTYAHADDVDGDIVLMEHQTVYESTNSDHVLMRVSIERHHDDYGSGHTTGELDTNADSNDLKLTAANVEGRAQITAMWYDETDRITDTVIYGTYGGSDFDRDGLSVPARSDTALLTEHAYNDDGTLKSVTDPEDLETRFEYDEAGRQTAVIANYVNGTPSGPTGDDDVHTRTAYTDGLKTKYWVDVDGDNVEDADDQVTTYTYGTTKGASAGDSNIGTGHLLQEVAYPDSTGSSDVVIYAYNAQNQEIYSKDQAGNVTETDFDDAGRQIHGRITTLASGFDGDVRRRSTTYDDLGRRELVTQYDNATVGSGSVVNEVRFGYDGWGNVLTFEQDHNSAVGASGSVDDLEVSYTYEKSSSSWQTVRRTSMDLPDSTTITYDFESLQGSDAIFDNDISRVTSVTVKSVETARYWYNGVNQVVGTIHDEADIMSEQYGATSGSYPDLDRFNRVTSSRWTRDIATDFDFYDVDVAYDRNSNIDLVEDNIHIQGNGMDVQYTNDDLNRLTQAEQGVWGGSSMTSTSHDQIWTLDQVGNWDHAQLDVNGDGDFTDTDEYDDDRTHNVVNELTGRDTDDNGTDNFTLTYDAAGNLTDDGEHYEYVYDAFGRLREIKNQSGNLVAEYEYNGLNHRVCWHYDVDADGSIEVDGTEDPYFYFAYDDRWRIVATYRDDDRDGSNSSDLSDEGPKERFAHHVAGRNGFGRASYIDDLIYRDRDANTAWNAESDGILEERLYCCQNWRNDVSILISSAGEMVEWVKYSAYGIPYGVPVGDTNSDGTVNSSDSTNIIMWWGSSTKPTGDTNLDGTINGTDLTRVNNQSGTSLGWGLLSHVGFRRGYAGYEADPELVGATWHVRNRVLISDLGRWMRRDPLEYVDGLSTYSYVSANSMARLDAYGLSGCNDLIWAEPSIDFTCVFGDQCLNYLKSQAGNHCDDEINEYEVNDVGGIRGCYDPNIGGEGGDIYLNRAYSCSELLDTAKEEWLHAVDTCIENDVDPPSCESVFCKESRATLVFDCTPPPPGMSQIECLIDNLEASIPMGCLHDLCIVPAQEQGVAPATLCAFLASQCLNFYGLPLANTPCAPIPEEPCGDDVGAGGCNTFESHRHLNRRSQHGSAPGNNHQ